MQTHDQARPLECQRKEWTTGNGGTRLLKRVRPLRPRAPGARPGIQSMPAPPERAFRELSFPARCLRHIPQRTELIPARQYSWNPLYIRSLRLCSSHCLVGKLPSAEYHEQRRGGELFCLRPPVQEKDEQEESEDIGNVGVEPAVVHARQESGDPSRGRAHRLQE